MARIIRRRRLIIIGAAIIGTFLAAEIGLRLLADSNSRFNVFIGAGREFDPELRSRLIPNYQYDGNRINSRGFLGPEFETMKRPDSLRIVTLGDSCSYIPESRNYPRVLEEVLRDRYPSRSIDVINASVPGYSTYQASRWYAREVDRYEHDALVIYLGWNDIAQFNPDGLAFKLKDQGYLHKPNTLQQAFISSYVLRSFYIIDGYWERSKPVSQKALSVSDERRYKEFYPSHYEELLRSTIELARSRNRHVLLLNFAGLISEEPTKDELARMHFPRGMRKSLTKYRLVLKSYESALQNVSRETHTQLVDIAAAFDTPERRKTFTDTLHYSRDGAERIAALVADALQPVIETSH